MALVIGNARYKSSSIGRLENPERDAKSVAQALDRAGFDVKVERNLAEGAFHNALEAFREKSRRAATAAFYYAGHGMEEGGVNYLIPVDMESPKATHDAVELDEVIGAMQGQRNLVFLDACRTPPGRGLRGDSDSPLRRGLAVVALETVDDILISYAAAPKKPALDGEKGGNSPYAAALAEHMVTPGQRLADMLMRVRNTVQGATEKEQRPWQSGSLGAPFYFVPEMPSVPDWESAWEQVKGIQDPAKVDQVRAYIREYRDEPRAARWVAVARVLADKLEELANPPPVVPAWERQWKDMVAGTRNPGTVRKYIEMWKGEPKAAVQVAKAEALLAKLVPPVAPPGAGPPAATGGGSGVPSGGARAPRPGQVWESPLGMEFAWVPAGRFVMGSPGSEAGREGNEGPQREVRISRGYWLGRYEVTQGEWEAVMGGNPSSFSSCGSRCPVENVSWEWVQGFIGRLNARESGRGNRYRLPTEAEWEYAARAGTVGARYGELDSIAWYHGNSGRRTHPVGQKRGNGWGLHDMLGNVWEWTADWYGKYPSGSVTDPRGPRAGSYRVARGGSWHLGAGYVRSAFRNVNSPGRRIISIGFRLVRTK